MVDSKIASGASAEEGRRKIAWAQERMPVLALLRERFRREKPFEGLVVGGCLHITSETANLALALKDGGATVALCASNPLSTKDDVAASLVVDHGVSVFAVHGEDRDSYYDNIARVLAFKPQVTLDDGGDLTAYAHEQEMTSDIWGGTEETTTGVLRFRAMERDGALRYPVVAVNESRTKYLFDNRYGTGQSTIDGILRATNHLIAGCNFVVCGYGWCGRGVALRARGMGARVIVTEVDPLKALEAAMDGFQVMPVLEAATVGDIFVTVTGNRSVIGEREIARMKNGAIVANSGHFDVEIDKAALARLAEHVERARPNVERYRLKDGRNIYLLAEGRLVNLGAAEGHPAAVMDMSFANQALAVDYIKKNRGKLEPRVYVLPEEIDREIAKLKLETMGIRIDSLTEEQKRYLSSWKEGT